MSMQLIGILTVSFSAVTSSVALYGRRSPAISLIQIESAPISSICFAWRSNTQVYKHLQCIGKCDLSMSALCWTVTAVCRLRRSFRQSKIRMISIPFAMDFCTKYSTTSSPYGRYPRMFCPRNSICSLVFLALSRILRSLSHGSSFRKRKEASKVAPPQHSRNDILRCQAFR